MACGGRGRNDSTSHAKVVLACPASIAPDVPAYLPPLDVRQVDRSAPAGRRGAKVIVGDPVFQVVYMWSSHSRSSDD
jgi:hypothetical protein